MQKNLKPGRRYMVINCDEPYAEEIYEILKERQQEKGEWPEGDISFEEWIEETFWDRETKEFQEAKEYANVFVDGELLIKVGDGYVDVGREKVVKEADLDDEVVDVVQDVEAASIVGKKAREFRKYKRQLIDKYRNYNNFDEDKLADKVVEQDPDVVVLTEAAFEKTKKQVKEVMGIEENIIKKFMDKPVLIVEGEEVKAQVGNWPEGLEMVDKFDLIEDQEQVEEDGE